MTNSYKNNWKKFIFDLLTKQQTKSIPPPGFTEILVNAQDYLRAAWIICERLISNLPWSTSAPTTLVL